MFVLITYNVNTETAGGKRRLRRVAKICESYGQRVQNSVFECLIDSTLWVTLSQKLIAEMDQELDSLRFYFLGGNWRNKVEHIGAHPSYDPQGPLII